MAGEKTEDPTQKKIRDARKDGKVPRSADFTAISVLLAAGVTAYVTRGRILGDLQGLIRTSVRMASDDAPEEHIGPLLLAGVETVGRATAPVLLAAFVIGAVVTYLQVGPLFATKPVTPDGERLNAAKGFKQLFGKDRGVDLLKNVARLSAMLVVGLFSYVGALGSVVTLTGRPVGFAFEVVTQVGARMAAAMAGALGVLAIIDLLIQRYRYTRDLRMTKKEVEDEYRESEGDPHIKAERRRLHEETARGHGLSDIEHADVVVVNPTHVAVALQYRPEQMQAPRVLARGRGDVAARLRRLARRHQIPIVRDVRLARSLVELELDREIPEDLFDAVAEVLHFVYSLGDNE